MGSQWRAENQGHDLYSAPTVPCSANPGGTGGSVDAGNTSSMCGVILELRIPKVFNLRCDPFERADTDSNNDNQWWDKKAGIVAMPALVRAQQFPLRQRPATFTANQMVEKFMHYQTQ